MRRVVYFVSGVSRSSTPFSHSFRTPYAKTGLVSEHAANAVLTSTGSFVPVSLTPNARCHASWPSRMIAIDTAGIFVSGSHCGIPASQAATSDSRNASFGVLGGRVEHAEKKSAPTPSAARPPSKRNSRRCTRRYYTAPPIVAAGRHGASTRTLMAARPESCDNGIGRQRHQHAGLHLDRHPLQLPKLVLRAPDLAPQPDGHSSGTSAGLYAISQIPAQHHMSCGTIAAILRSTTGEGRHDRPARLQITMRTIS